MKRPHWMDNPPTSLADKARLLKTHSKLLKSPGAKGRFLRNLLKEIQNQYTLMVERAKELDPLQFIKPSYEQALVLNSWMYGISFNCIYSANRIGKTTACILNIILWLFPNNPKWLIFKPYRIGDPKDDPENHDSPRKSQLVKVFPRPDISALKKIKDALKRLPSSLLPPDPSLPHYEPRNAAVLQWLQSVVPEVYYPVYPDAPWNRGGTIWFGAPDQDHHEQVMFPMWKQYLPAHSQERYVPSEREITIKITSPTGRTTVWELIGKSYESKDTKWSSGAVDAIMLTEGFKIDVWKEIKNRFKDPGVGSHDYTPYLPANAGQASALAQRIAKGAEPLPLSYHVFQKFSVRNAPRHIISKDKQEGMIRSWENDPQGRARIDGEFYASSMLVLSNLSREHNLLDWSKEELFARFPTARLYRGLDPGLDHPTSCAWGALLPNNIWVIYRIFSEQGLTIPDRCKKIIELSGNKISKIRFGSGEQDFYAIETHSSPKSEIFNATIADYHTFKQDEVTGNAYALNYITNGLTIIESEHTRPEHRAELLNGDLKPNQFIPSLLTNRPAGPKVLFLKNEPGIMDWVLRMEEFYWARKLAGEDKGQPKDQVPLHGDDELDAICYLTCSRFKWTNFRPPARVSGDSEVEMQQIEAIQSLRQGRPTQLLQRLQNQQVVHFGDMQAAIEDDDV